MTRKALSSASGVSERYLATSSRDRETSPCCACARWRADGVAVDHLVRERPRAPRAARIALIGCAAPQVDAGEKARALARHCVRGMDKEVEKEAGAKLARSSPCTARTPFAASSGARSRAC